MYFDTTKEFLDQDVAYFKSIGVSASYLTTKNDIEDKNKSYISYIKMAYGKNKLCYS